MMERFDKTRSVEEAESICKLCSLLPDSVDRAKLPSALVVEALEKNDVPPDFPPWGYACLALTAYREGEFEQAVRWCEQALMCRDLHPQNAAMALVVQALAQHQLQQTQSARQSLVSATAPFRPAC